MSPSRESSKRGPYESGPNLAFPVEFNERLRWLRKSWGLTQVELAAALGCEQTMISSWESGRNRPTAATLEALARFYRLPARVVETGEGFIAQAENVLKTIRAEGQPTSGSITLTLDPPTPGCVGLVDQGTNLARDKDASESVNQILRALKQGRDVWVVLR